MTRPSAAAATPARVLLEGLVDYAGLFPPAGLPMADAVERYATYIHGPDSWLLGRFVVPASRIDAFEAARRPRAERRPWRLSVLLSAEPERDLRALEPLASKEPGGVRVESVELPVLDAADVGAVCAGLPPSVETFVETPLDDRMERCLEAVARAGARPKCRTGGIQPEAVPEGRALARFLVACRDHGVSFKATAGLHHAVRAAHPLTYEPGSPVATMHGFLNLLAAAALARGGHADAGQVQAVLEETDPRAFTLNERGLAWRRLATDPGGLAAGRAFFRSFGSCSFTEPVDDLRSLELL